MKLLWFLLFGFGLFFALFIGGKKYRGTALYALAIGGAVNANFFHAANYPIDIFHLSFGIDAILYNLFIFCVIVMFFEKNKKEAYLLAISSIIATLLAGFFDSVAEILSNGGYFDGAFNCLINFSISSFSSVICVVIILELLDLFTKKKIIKYQYILLSIGMVIATLLNSPIYYTLASLVFRQNDNLLNLTISSLIGKAFAIIMALTTLFLLRIIDKHIAKKQASKEAKESE